jgi:sugar lactone lactonase YvrE
MLYTRRSLLKSAGVLGGPVILGAQNKSGSARPVIGEGEFRYEVIHDWGELPAQIKYGNTHGVCEDSNGNIYVHHTVNAASESSDSMVVFDAKGKFIKSWGSQFKGGAHGLHIRKEGSTEYLYLCDTRRAVVVKTTLSGEEVFTLGYPKESGFYKPGADGNPQRKYSPTNLAIAPNGDIYVGDGYGSSYINQYNSKGEFIRTFGGKGAEAGQVDCPHGMIMDMRGRQPVLMVADRTNRRIQNFSLDGKHLSFVSGVNLPCHFSEHKGVMVVPDLGARVSLIDRENRVIAHLGDDSAAGTWRKIRTQPRETFTPGKFVCPHGACFDHDGNIFVAEWVEVGRVTKLRHVS